MELQLTQSEHDFMVEVLAEHQRELFLELSKASHREFKNLLKEKVDVLDTLLAKLDAKQAKAA